MDNLTKKSLNTLLFILLIWIAYLGAKLIASTWDNLANTDFMTFWLAGKSVVMGYDAYNAEEWLYWREYFGSTWIFNPRFIYPLPLRLLLAPLGLIPLPQAFLLWTIVSEFLVLFSVYLLYTRVYAGKRNAVLPFLFAGSFLFRPTYTALRFGQIGPWLLITMVFTILLWKKKQWFWGGFLLSMVVLKPTIGGPFILLILVWLAGKKLWKGVAGLAVGGLFLMLLGMVQDPNWVAKFLQGGNQKMGETFGYAPNLWGIARLITGGKAVVLVGGILSLLLVGFAVFILLKSKHPLSFITYISVITPVVLMTTPYIWVYDQLFLLIPITLLVVFMENRDYPFVFTSLIFVIAAAISFILVLPTRLVYYDFFSVLLPLIVLVALAHLLLRSSCRLSTGQLSRRS